MKNIIQNKFRLQLLSKNIIRFEYAPKKNFLDDNTFFIPNRDGFNEELLPYEVEETKEYKIVQYGDYVIYLPTRKVRDFFITDLKGTIIYQYKFQRNCGELPLPHKTPELFVLSDNPHILLPKEGYTVHQEDPTYVVDEKCVDLYFIFCKKDAALLRKCYVELTGKAELVPLYALGYWNSKWYPYSEETAKRNIIDHLEHNIPLDMMVLDTDWRANSDQGMGYDINLELFPDLSRFFAFAKENHVHTIFNDHPEPVKDAKNAMDIKEMAFREEKLTHILDLGLDAWWYDRNWWTKLVSPTKYVLPETIGLYLFHDIIKHQHQSLAKDKNKYARALMLGNVNNIANGTYIKIHDSASHRYSVQWTGDIPSTLISLRREVHNMLQGGNNAIGYVNPDCGGHYGNPNKEEFIRWMQFGAFSPIFRPHCTRNLIRSREPWLYDEETLDITREYIDLRYRLLPVIYRNAFKNYQTGKPIYESLSMRYPKDNKAVSNKDEYLLENLLVAPIIEHDLLNVRPSQYASKVKATYFNGLHWEGEPLLEKTYDRLHFFWDNVPPEDGVPTYNFSAIFELDLCFKSDVQFVIECDDGIKVELDDEVVYDQVFMHGAENEEIAFLKKNKVYHVKIYYTQGEGGACIALHYAKVNSNNGHEFYLPKGRWMNLFTGKKYLGNRTYKDTFELHHMPLFIKMGSLIPLANNALNTATQKWNQLVFDFYPTKRMVVEDYLYEDDTFTTAYQFGEYKLSKYKAYFDKEKNSYMIRFYASIGTFDGDKNFNKRWITLKYHLLNQLDKIDSVTFDNKPIEINIQAKNKEVYPLNTTLTSPTEKVVNAKFELDLSKDSILEIHLK